MKCAVVAFAMAATITLGTFSAVAAQTSAQQFTLVVNGKNDQVTPSVAFPMGWRHVGSFTASSPFCASGTFEDLTNDYLNSSGDTRTYTCADGSGTIVTEQETWYEHKSPYTSTWRILRGTGGYAGLRGKGSFVGEPPLTGSNDGDDPSGVTYRCTFHGVVDFDVVAPTITASRATITKLRRPSGSYALGLRLALRDNVRGNAVSYTVAIEPAGGGLYLVEKKGTSRAGEVTLRVRFRPQTDARQIRLNLRAEDPVGNWRWVMRRLKLPR
jgi:hypothetical protein